MLKDKEENMTTDYIVECQSQTDYKFNLHAPHTIFYGVEGLFIVHNTRYKTDEALSFYCVVCS